MSYKTLKLRILYKILQVSSPIRVWWNFLCIRQDPLHRSLDLDIIAYERMSAVGRKDYLDKLCGYREIAFNRANKL